MLLMCEFNRKGLIAALAPLCIVGLRLVQDNKGRVLTLRLLSDKSVMKLRDKSQCRLCFNLPMVLMSDETVCVHVREDLDQDGSLNYL